MQLVNIMKSYGFPLRNYSSVDNIMRRANSVHSVNGEAGNGTYR